MRESYAQQVLSFMTLMKQYPRHRHDQVPQEDFNLASKLIQEELQEFTQGFNKFEAAQSFENMAEMVDGAIDLIYVILWAMNKFNIPVDDCFDEVQRSNMAKVGKDGVVRRSPEGKVLKPEGWKPPDIHWILVEHFDHNR
jgi:predicted HAD superfamily Cof-like phosphohydrolase